MQIKDYNADMKLKWPMYYYTVIFIDTLNRMNMCNRNQIYMQQVV